MQVYEEQEMPMLHLLAHAGAVGLTFSPKAASAALQQAQAAHQSVSQALARLAGKLMSDPCDCFYTFCAGS